MNTAFVVCTRLHSSRLRNKAIRNINGKPVIEHLLDRLHKTGLPVVLAIPESDAREYKYLDRMYNNTYIYTGSPEDPLARMTQAANQYGIDNVIRVTHDKIFVDPETVLDALEVFCKKNVEYLYSSRFTDGSSFEIIKRSCLKKAETKYKDVEFISYAAKSVASSMHDYDVKKSLQSDLRLLIDYDEDLNLLETVLSGLGNDCSLSDVLSFYSNNPWIKHINKMPDLTVYTCAYNSALFIENAFRSVVKQSGLDIEYILIDDHSDDKTPFLMSRFSLDKPNVSWMRNKENMGLASSSNVAMKHARGKYIMRLDSDDYFLSFDSCLKLFNEIKATGKDVIYPNFYDGDIKVTGMGRTSHHPAGAIFSSRALNHLKFTDDLRHFDGLDLYHRAKTQLNIGYFNQPTFFYTHREGSLSNSEHDKRDRIKNNIERSVTDELTI